MAATTLMALSSGIAGVGSFATAGAQAGAERAQGEYQRQQFEANARLAEGQAKSAIERGDAQADQYATKVSQAVGSQRAALAAQGISVDAGSAADIQAETKAMGQQDVQQIRNNAWREAWGYKVQASDLRNQGAFAELEAKGKASKTLLTGGLEMTRGLIGAAEKLPSRTRSPSSDGPRGSGTAYKSGKSSVIA